MAGGEERCHGILVQCSIGVFAVSRLTPQQPVASVQYVGEIKKGNPLMSVGRAEVWLGLKGRK